MALLPKKRDRTNDNFRRVVLSIMKRCHRISLRYDVDVYICLRRDKRYFTYVSTEDAFPPPQAEIVCNWTVNISRYTNSLIGEKLSSSNPQDAA
jgi:hypothetical protein